jgi:hypothetical protein
MRTIESFVPTVTAVIAELDASLSGAGLICYTVEIGAEVAKGVCAVDLTFLEFGTDSSFQNLSEFIGAILAVMGQIAIGLSGQSLALRGVSVTAHQGESQRFDCNKHVNGEDPRHQHSVGHPHCRGRQRQV